MHRSGKYRAGADYVGLAAPIASHYVFGTSNPGPVILNVLLHHIDLNRHLKEIAIATMARYRGVVGSGTNVTFVSFSPSISPP